MRNRTGHGSIPHGLFGLADGSRIDSKDFSRLYNGFAPDGSGKLNQNAGKESRSPGLDMTFSVDKSVSAVWAIAEPEMRAEIERLAVTAAQAALQDTVFEHCSYTRVKKGGSDVGTPVPADLIGAVFPHGTSRENDPQLHIHCTILNVARTHQDGKYRAHHQYPVYSWSKAAGALFRAYLAWDLQQQLGVKMEQYGPNGAYTRIPGMPEDLLSFWSKRRKAIIAKAGELGIPVRGNASRLAGVNKLTRAGKSHDNDPEIRHRRWRGEVDGFTEREVLIASVTGNEVDIPREHIRELTEQLDTLPAYLAREEAVFKRPDMVEAAANRAAGLLGREAVVTAIERVRCNPEIEALILPKATAESNAGMVHTERYSTRHNLGMEQAVRDMAEAMADDRGHGLPAQAVRTKVETLLADGYPLSEEQIRAIRFATARGARVAVIEGAAGSGKTTTLRPITDLHREHGYEIVPTAVAWRTAVALGNDCDARPVCVDKLLKMAARGQMEIGKRTLVVVDEAGMLSTRQAHHILQLGQRHGAKIVFAGDTRQQQPVEAGPGLRLIRDVAGCARVDKIRRQKADLEDILVYALGETRERAWHRAVTMERQERDRILSYHGPKLEQALITPWQVLASEALRDGDGAAAIEAWRKRGRCHICHDEENTLTRLVEDWARGVREEPGKSSVVLARTRAETRALSHLMRERHLAGKPDTERVVVEVSRNVEDGRIVEPLEIAVGDRLRIGATQWEKQLFNGTIVTVEDLKVLSGEVGTEPDGGGLEPVAPSVSITARTDDGREVVFRHDEIRDYHDNIRLDYGYALTITSAQGLTVDRAYLLADDRPARETIYPASTRHRERLDIYINRAPLAITIAERRPEDQAERPVMDSDIRTHLADRWSRSQPKEAALDYITDGAWRDQREKARHNGGDRQSHDDVRAVDRSGIAANDNALARIAGEIRRTAFGWRHGQAVAAFADGRREILAAYDDLRERTRAEGDAVALGGIFRETLTRHGVLLKQAETFRARPADYSSLLAERGGIGPKELDAFEELHDRASRHRRAATMRHVHRIKRETELALTQQPEPEPRENAAPTPAHAGQSAATDTTPAQPDVRTLYEAVERDWNQLVERAREAGVPTFDMEGSELLIERMRSLTVNPELPARTRQAFAGVIQEYRQGELALEGGHVGAPGGAKTVARGVAEAPPPDHAATLVESAVTPDATVAPPADEDRVPSPVQEPTPPVPDPEPEPAEPVWLPAYEALVQDWNALAASALQSGTLSFYLRGYADLISRLRVLAENPDIPTETRTPMIKALENHEINLSARKKVEDWLSAVERHKDRRDSLEDGADRLDMPVAEAPEYPGWRQEAEHLTNAGKAILSDTETFGAHLANITRGELRMNWALSKLREAVRDDDEELARHKAREQPERVRHSAGLKFAVDEGADPARADTPGVLSMLRHAIGRIAGGADYDDRMQTEMYTRQALERWETLKRDWNRQVEQADREGVHVIYTDGYDHLHERLDTLSQNMLLDYDIQSEMRTVLSKLDRAVSNRRYVDTWRNLMAGQLDCREALEAEVATRGVPDHREYDTWRNLTDKAVDRCEEILADRGRYGIHLDDIARRGESLASALSRVRETLRDDDRHIAATLVQQREGEDVSIREERIARLLDDPEKLRELRQKRAKRKAGKLQRKDRHMSRGIRM